jgi:hypothetical protein
MEKNLVKKPERLDDLKDMNEFIYYISINDKMFKNRSMKFMDWTKGMNEVYAEVSIPNDHIICDICNWNIALDKPEKIPLLCEIGMDKSETIVKKALCEKCVEKYYPKLIKIAKLTK